MNQDSNSRRKSKSTKFRQLSFDHHSAFQDFKKRIEHGGGFRAGKRKLHRPFDSNQSLHVTLRASRARGGWSFIKTKNEKNIKALLYAYADRFGVKIQGFANAGNHIHLLLKASSQKGFQNFMRAFCGMIPRKICGAEKGRGIGKFWDELVYTKLVSFGRQFTNTLNYVFRNALEGAGVIPPRSTVVRKVRMNYLEFFD